MDRGVKAARAIVVRRARADDEAFVVALARRFAETRPGWRSEREVTRGTEVELRRAFATPDAGSVLLVADDASGERLGFAYLVLHEDFFTKERHGHVSELAVTKDGAGAGGRLIDAAEQYFLESGVRFVTLNVNEGNERGRSFYERHGFVPHLRQLVKVLRDPTDAGGFAADRRDAKDCAKRNPSP